MISGQIAHKFKKQQLAINSERESKVQVLPVNSIIIIITTMVTLLLALLLTVKD